MSFSKGGSGNTMMWLNGPEDNPQNDRNPRANAWTKVYKVYTRARDWCCFPFFFSFSLVLLFLITWNFNCNLSHVSLFKKNQKKFTAVYFWSSIRISFVTLKPYLNTCSYTPKHILSFLNLNVHFPPQTFSFLFRIGVQPIHNAAVISGEHKGTQPYVCQYPFSPKIPSHPGCRITLGRVPCAVH